VHLCLHQPSAYVSRHYVSIRPHTPAYVSTQHTSAHSILQHTSIRQHTAYVSTQHTSAHQHTWAHVSPSTECPGLTRPSFCLLCQYLYFCTRKASKLKFTVFFAPLHSNGFQKPCNAFYRPYFCLQRTQDRLASVFAPYVRIRQHSSAYVIIQQYTESPGLVRQYSTFCVSICNHGHVNHFHNPLNRKLERMCFHISKNVKAFSAFRMTDIGKNVMWNQILYGGVYATYEEVDTDGDGDSLLNRYLTSADICRYMWYAAGYKGDSCPQISGNSHFSPHPLGSKNRRGGYGKTIKKKGSPSAPEL
jgi:hypothetical protein